MNPTVARKVKYIPGNVYNYMKETFIKNWKYKILLGLVSSEHIHNFTNHNISEINMRCKFIIRELCYETSKQFEPFNEFHVIVRALSKNYKRLGEEIFGVCRKFIRS